MVRRTSRGRAIISAGEVGVYTVCPEAWRLQYVERKRVDPGEKVEEGRREHQKWATTYDRALELSRWIRRVFILLFIAIIITIILNIFR